MKSLFETDPQSPYFLGRSQGRDGQAAQCRMVELQCPERHGVVREPWTPHHAVRRIVGNPSNLSDRAEAADQAAFRACIGVGLNRGWNAPMPSRSVSVNDRQLPVSDTCGYSAENLWLGHK